MQYAVFLSDCAWQELASSCGGFLQGGWGSVLAAQFGSGFGDIMFLFVYCQPLWAVILTIAGSIVLWTAGGRCATQKTKSARLWYAANVLLFVLAVGIVLYATLLGREPGEHTVRSVPFYSFRMALEQPEIYRAMLMNIFLFVPLGLSLPVILPRGWSVRRRVMCTVLFGLVFSCFIESVQFFKMLGDTEIDDVLTNTLGTALGASPLFWQEILRKYTK